jgi:hypothetical protein
VSAGLLVTREEIERLMLALASYEESLVASTEQLKGEG